MATKTSTIGLNQYVGSDYVKMADFNTDNLLIDKAFKEDRAKMKTLEESLEGISTSASGTTFNDTIAQLGAEDVQKAIERLVTRLKDVETKATNTASKVTALEPKVEGLETELNGQVTKLSGINTELEAEIGTPTE